MNDSDPARHRPGTALAHGVRQALLPGPDDPPGARLPWPLWARVLFLTLLTGATVGLTGGTIAIPLTVFRPPPPTTVAWLLAAAQVVPLLASARWPLAAWRVSALGFLVGGLVLSGRYFFPWPVPGWIAFLVLLFLVALAGAREATAGVGAVTIFGVIAPVVLVGAMPGWFGVILSGMVVLALILGDAIGGRSSAEAELRVRTEQHRQDLARQAVLEERARIARELHDVVAHHMSVIAMQAEAAPYKITDMPPAARQTFEVVRDAAREALTETRRVVGLLRSDDEGAERAPQPGLERLDDLVATARRYGLTIEVAVVGMPRSLGAGVDLSAYRIVQESFSNAARYAPGSAVRAEIHYGPQALRVEVTDDGPRGEAADSPGGGENGADKHGGGHGLVGMRERVTMLGGRLAAGPRGPGWSVVAELPYGDPD
ncbi:sensor histidine kinase [Actinomadura macrotermitis]|uniref:histidine kinase n=1 Tax=Actinomadura macrotermitis TaxID=2585200 RepID=A0A7K0C8E6_9ACTN|nr:sensor histidine kinase [Actinomadura macrotermitis]MQY09751.1 hypothetical protein [Actinomadura macrotermitis]